MKNLKINTRILSTVLIALVMSVTNVINAQHDHSKMHHNKSSKKDVRAKEVNNQKNTATTLMIGAYIEIKNGLATDNNKNAAKGGTALVKAFSVFEMTKLSAETHKEYMEIMESAKEHAEHIIKSDLKHQREHFLALSTDIIDLVALLGTEKTLYKDFCPMANNNKGGFWLSEIKDIKNPYYGARMLKCGSVKKQIN